MLEDQFNIPEDIRPFDTGRNPYARKELWKSQDQLNEELQMRNPNWYPKSTQYNIYNQESFDPPREIVENNSKPKA